MRLMVLFAMVLCARAEDWPRFLGPRADNTSNETNLIDSIPASGAKVVWDLQIGAGYGAPSVRGGRLVLHHRKEDEEVVREIDVATGDPRWKYSYPSHYRDPYGY